MAQGTVDIGQGQRKIVSPGTQPAPAPFDQSAQPPLGGLAQLSRMAQPQQQMMPPIDLTQLPPDVIAMLRKGAQDGSLDENQKMLVQILLGGGQ